MAISHPPPKLSKRRSTRVSAGVFVGVRGIDANGQPFTEQRVTLEVGFQGCKFYSRYALPKNSWLTVEVSNKQSSSVSQRFRARVAWRSRSRTLPGLFQVGVELEAPGNIWGISNPPEDWGEPAKPKSSAVTAFEKEMKELIALAETGTYYQLLRTTSDSARAQVRQSYYRIMRKFHPDLHMDRAEWTEPLHRLTEAVTLAYKTLTDDTARSEYDERLASSSAFTLRRQQSDLQKTAEECLQKARECLKAQNPGGTILWLRKATEMEPRSEKYHALLARTLSRVVTLRREAIEHFERALEIDPSNTTVRLQVAALYEEMKLPWRAQLHYQKILEVDSDDLRAQKRLHLLDADPSQDSVIKRSIADRILRRSPK